MKLPVSVAVCLLAIFMFGLSVSATERGALLEAAIASVKEEFAAKESTAQSNIPDAEKKLRFFKKATAESAAQGNARLRFEKMVKKAELSILESHRHATVQTAEEKVESLAMELLHKPGTVLTKQEIARIFEESDCPRTTVSAPKCDPMTGERTANGLCNNLQNPTFGAANTPMRRLIAARYDDGISRLQGTLQIREVSIVPGPFSPPNPSPRVVSINIITDRPENDTEFSHILMQWGQFMDHDLDAIPQFEGTCPSSCEVEEDTCVPFPVTEDDEEVTRISGSTRFCHGFRRSLAACDAESPDAVEPREQINSITHFIDGSNVYHHDPDIQMTLIRNQSSPDGLLNVGAPVKGTSRPSLPFIDIEANPDVVECTSRNCFLAGDFRVNEHIALTTMHTIWLREHNRIAQMLRANSKGASSNDLFQTARSIVIAEIQKITYKDYLSILLGKQFLDLIPSYSGYNDTVEPNIPNSFSTAAYRFGHSQIQPFFERLDENYQSIPEGPLPLVDAFFNPSQFIDNGGADPILRGLLTKNARQVDEFLNSILTNRLFSESSSSPGLDLASLNIQRGRDHGLPKYLTWKQWAKKRCGVESEFRSQLTQVRLLQTYGGLNNVDLFVGGLAEEPLPGGLVGAVFACIIANTFLALRDGDRFYYENPKFNGGKPLFTAAQRAEIEKTSLSRIICDNSDITEIQTNAFMVSQKRISCSQIPSVDLSQWSSSPVRLPNNCYIRFNSGNSGRRHRKFKAISHHLKTRKFHISAKRVRGMRDDCLSFVCPRSGAETKLVVTSVGCPTVRTNMNLKSTSKFNNQYAQILSVSDIQTQNGLYTSRSSCQTGTDTALFFCEGNGGGDLEAKILDQQDTPTEQEDEEVDVVDEKELRRLLEDIPGDHIDEIIGPEAAAADNDKLIALMEEVLENLAKPSTSDHKHVPDQMSSIMELEEAIKELH